MGGCIRHSVGCRPICLDIYGGWIYVCMYIHTYVRTCSNSIELAHVAVRVFFAFWLAAPLPPPPSNILLPRISRTPKLRLTQKASSFHQPLLPEGSGQALQGNTAILEWKSGDLFHGLLFSQHAPQGLGSLTCFCGDLNSRGEGESPHGERERVSNRLGEPHLAQAYPTMEVS